jgi:hypothetical protein
VFAATKVNFIGEAGPSVDILKGVLLLVALRLELEHCEASLTIHCSSGVVCVSCASTSHHGQRSATVGALIHQPTHAGLRTPSRGVSPITVTSAETNRNPMGVRGSGSPKAGQFIISALS